MTRRCRFGIASVMVVMMLAGCGSDSPEDAGSTGPMDHSTSSEHASEEGFGHASDAKDADRTITVFAVDPHSFQPELMTVEAGETIEFVVKNNGDRPHEFVLGDRASQEEHAEGMGHEMHMEETAAAIALAPKETKSLTWTFTSPGEVLYACHEPGHYDGGMIGTITVQ